ncbi:MAG: transposase [Chloroflexota bacterium]
MPTYKRKPSIRKPNWDYRNPSYYFVTICTQHREPIFQNTNIKQATEWTWRQIPTWPQSEHVVLDRFVVMPDHVHGLLFLTSGYDHEPHSQPNNAPGSLGAIIGTYKSNAGNRARALLGSIDMKIWQRGYYDRIVRDESELNRIREYIRLNPIRAAERRDNLDLLLSKMTYHDGP